MKGIYALYKGDEFLSLGTIKEIAKEMNIKESTIRFYNKPSYMKRAGKNARVIIKVEED